MLKLKKNYISLIVNPSIKITTKTYLKKSFENKNAKIVILFSSKDNFSNASKKARVVKVTF